jgi:5-oxoprolinase (ATP-hydrolysing)
MLRVGVDIGGTFTDLMTFDEESGTVSRNKVLTTPRAPEEGLLEACRAAGVEVEGVSHFVHGTTLVTNLVIERQGAKVGLITTKGFRDILLFQTGMREESFDLQWERCKALVPRHLIVEVSERMDKEGSPVTPVNAAEVAEAVRYLIEKGVTSIAVCLFNSYASGEHEAEVGRIIAGEAPQVYVSLSSNVDPRIREYPRASTTVLNAYAMPRVYGYVERLEKALEIQHGIKYMHSGGGLISSAAARERPIALVESGPAAGVLACRYLGEKLGIKQIITADMGGTSFDVCMIRDGVPEITDTTDVEFGIPVRSDSIDVVSIGAGGGSIAWIDEGGSLRVGPRSAGADPGPACYNFGGTEPTTTDANMVLGTLNPDNFLGGESMKLDPDKSWQAMQPIADHFGISVPDAAQGVYKIVNASMAQAVRQVTVKKGIDPREFTLVPFGGAGAQHAIDVAKELDITSVLFPVNASTLSALGMMTADISYTESRTVSSPLEDLSMDRMESDFRELEARALGYLEGDESKVASTGVEWKADARYVGQSFELRVPLPRSKMTRELVYQEFERAYRERYDMVLGDPAEVVNIHATATGYIQSLELPKSNGTGHGAPTPKGHRKMAFYDSPVPVYDRETLRHGMVLESPCIVEEVDNTIFLPEGCTSRVDEYGNIRTTITETAARAVEELDPFTAEIIRSYLISTVEEMMKSTTSVAYSSTFAERLDFTCGIFDSQGRMVAQSQGIPTHAGTMMDSMMACINAFDGTFKEGDAVILNDVYQGGSHQPDVMIMRPIFYEGRIIAFSANRGHWTDIGGMSAGGFSGTARHVVQEALNIPPAKIFEAGVVSVPIRDFILKNVRIPHQIWGDIQSQMAANLTAERRMKALIDKYGLELVQSGMDAALDYGRRRFRQKLLEMPDGRGTAVDFIDTDGYTDHLWRVEVAVEKVGDRIKIDCTGSDPQTYAVVNSSLVSSKANIYVAVISVVDPGSFINSGVIEMIDLVLPEGTIVNPHSPAPVSAGWYAMLVLCDAAIAAFGEWLPDRVTASSHGDRDNTTWWGFSPETGKEWVWYLSQHGGAGARATKDGEPIAPNPRNNSRIPSLELWERQYPVLFHKYEMTADSGGPGRQRGGLAGYQEFLLLEDALYSAAATRHILKPKGIFGGGGAATHAFHRVDNGTLRTIQELYDLPSPSKFSNLPVKKGQVFVVESGGGGGYGDALDRDVEKVEMDVLEGYVSLEGARRDYGVWIDPDTGTADRAKTDELRKKMRAGG